MAVIHFITHDNQHYRVQVAIGDTLLDAALDNGVPGIIGQCGGGCTCCTCHCYIDRAFRNVLTAPHRDELDMLDYAEGRNPDSRLACQVKVVAALDGMEVRLPASQTP